MEMIRLKISLDGEKRTATHYEIFCYISELKASENGYKLMNMNILEKYTQFVDTGVASNV
ncbi:MAG: hypothetical protein JW870_10075 [Candidatus Delongbacteria bacterium]|nr:hypothetical protein [Candidatus Delongbacteria bacterium]